MKIARIETIAISSPSSPSREIKGSSGYHTASPFLVVKVHTDDDIIGLGEVSCTPRWSGEDNVTAAHWIRTVLGPLLFDRDPADIEGLAVAMRMALPGNAFTRAGVEMALWDILGKAAGLPLYRLLG